MLIEYIGAAMRHARFEYLDEDRTYYGEIPEFQGVWGDGETMDECRRVLQEVLEDWLVFRISRRLPLPTVDGIELRIPEPA